MEASLLVAPPKPSVSVLASTRGQPRRCIVAVAAAGSGKEPDARSDRGGNNGHQGLLLLPSNKVLAAAMTGAILLQPCCHDASAALGPPPPALAPELYRAVAVLGDLDPATAKTVAGFAGPALSAFGFLFILRIVMSWYPRLPVTKFPYVLAYAPTEPFLAVTRKVIPPLGGVDVTPVVWFGLVSFLNEILVGPQGLLILLSQQV